MSVHKCKYFQVSVLTYDEKKNQNKQNKMVCEPLVPLMMWMLSPAVILAWTSVELLVPGITMSETN